MFPWTSASVSPFLYTSPSFIPCTAITFPRAFTPTTPFWPLTSGNTVQTNLNKKATCSSVHVNRNMYKKTMIFVYVIRYLCCRYHECTIHFKTRVNWWKRYTVRHVYIDKTIHCTTRVKLWKRYTVRHVYTDKTVHCTTRVHW